MNIQEFLIHVSRDYLKSKIEPLANHPLARVIRDESKQVFEPLLSNKSLLVVGSAGKGNWAEVPWVGILDPNETDGPQEGLYVVYLMSADAKRWYLALGQGTNRPIERDTKRTAIEKLQARATDIRLNFPLSGWVTNTNIELVEGTGLGDNYAKTAVWAKEYKTDAMPDNAVLENDLQTILALYANVLEDSNLVTADTDFSPHIQDHTGVEEGRRLLKQHFIRERNRGVVQAAKQIAIQKNGQLICAVCSYSFEKHFGERGKNYIEGHHIKAVSQIKPGDKTKPEDIALVCSNCHRMIHRKDPYLGIDELRSIYHS
jgi:5-methylcytosine-specific restriction protein A